MFIWNDPKNPKTDEEIAYDITDMLFAGKDVRYIERTIVKELRERRVETIDWLIDECRDKILELRIDDREPGAVTKLEALINALESYRKEARQGFIPVPWGFRNHEADATEQSWCVALVWLICMVWAIFWVLRG